MKLLTYFLLFLHLSLLKILASEQEYHHNIPYIPEHEQKEYIPKHLQEIRLRLEFLYSQNMNLQYLVPMLHNHHTLEFSLKDLITSRFNKDYLLNSVDCFTSEERVA